MHPKGLCEKDEKGVHEAPIDDRLIIYHAVFLWPMYSLSISLFKDDLRYLLSHHCSKFLHTCQCIHCTAH